MKRYDVDYNGDLIDNKYGGYVDYDDAMKIIKKLKRENKKLKDQVSDLTIDRDEYMARFDGCKEEVKELEEHLKDICENNYIQSAF